MACRSRSSTSPNSRGWSRSPSRTPIARSSAVRVGAEVRFGARNIGLRGDELDRRRVEARWSRWASAGSSRVNPYDLGFSRRKLLAHRRRSWPWRRRSSSSTSRRPARTRAASTRIGTIVDELARRRPHRDRDQPRHALRRRAIRAGRRHARGPSHPRRHARGRCSASRLAGAGEHVPRTALRGARSAHSSARLDADRRRLRRGPRPALSYGVGGRSIASNCSNACWSGCWLTGTGPVNGAFRE